MHRRTLSKVAGEAVKQLVVRNYCVVFAGVVVREDEEGKGRLREKERVARRERVGRVLELFLEEST